MMVNNPVYTMRIADLLDMFDKNFTYDDLYHIVYKWLETEKQYFFTDDDVVWTNFIEAFCDRFYSRNINFNTTLEFKLKLRDVLRKYKDRAERVYKVNTLKLNPLMTYRNVVTRSENGKGNTSGTVNNTVTTDGSRTSKTTDKTTNKSTEKNYNLHSDTPANAVNIDDLFSVAKNYVTDADNQKNTLEGSAIGETSTSDTNKNKDVSSGINSSKYENSTDLKEISKGYNGNQVDLVNKFMALSSNVINYYLDWIESECLFSAILY